MSLSNQATTDATERVDRELHAATRPFAHDSAARSWWYIGSTFGLLAVVLTGAAIAPWWPLRLAGSLLGALILVRAFILYHDFMHGAILPGSRVARAIFYTYAALNLTPPRSWRDSHNFHHANVGKILGSNVGSFPLMTIHMWQAASPMQRLRYRVVRHPLTILSAYLTVFLGSVTLAPLFRRPPGTGTRRSHSWRTFPLSRHSGSSPDWTPRFSPWCCR